MLLTFMGWNMTIRAISRKPCNPRLSLVYPIILGLLNGFNLSSERFCARLRSGKRFPSVDLCMSGPGRTPRTMPSHESTKRRIWFSVSVRTYLAFVTNSRQKLNHKSVLISCLRMFSVWVHFTFLLSSWLFITWVPRIGTSGGPGPRRFGESFF